MDKPVQPERPTAPEVWIHRIGDKIVVQITDTRARTVQLNGPTEIHSVIRQLTDAVEDNRPG